MRGDSLEGGDLFSYVSLEKRIPKGHPIRTMRKLVDEALANLDPLFNEIYADNGRLKAKTGLGISNRSSLRRHESPVPTEPTRNEASMAIVKIMPFSAAC